MILTLICARAFGVFRRAYRFSIKALEAGADALSGTLALGSAGLSSCSKSVRKVRLFSSRLAVMAALALMAIVTVVIASLLEPALGFPRSHHRVSMGAKDSAIMNDVILKYICMMAKKQCAEYGHGQAPQPPRTRFQKLLSNAFQDDYQGEENADMAL